MFAAIVSIGLIGYLAQRFGICLVRATNDLLHGDPRLLFAILISGAWVWAYSIFASVNGWELPFERHQINWGFILGGFVFGFGASINQGCSISTMNQLAKGNIGKFVTVLGWFIGWSIWIYASAVLQISDSYVKAPTLSLTETAAISLSVFSISVFLVWKLKPQISLIVGVSLIGLLASALYYLEPLWAPSQLIQDTGHALLFDRPLPSTFRFLLIMSLLIGMWCSALIHHRMTWRKLTAQRLIRYFLAGTMMGIGAGMALGGNDAQLLFGLPGVSLGGLAALTFMLLGISIEQTAYARGWLFYKKV